MGTVNIIGSGLAGSIVSLVLRSWDIPTCVIDDCDETSASRASSNLFCASWLKKWSKPAAAGIGILEQLFADNIRVDFPGIDVRLVRTEDCLVEPDVIGRVEKVDQQGCYLGPRLYKGPTVVCTGWRGAGLVDMPEIKVKTGHALFYPGRVKEPRLNLVSPFTHQKAFQYDDKLVYYADSVAVLDKNYWPRQSELIRRSRERAMRFAGLENECGMRVGRRPFIVGHPYGYYKKDGNVYVVNGGGKNGMVAYANIACRLRKDLAWT